MSSALKDLFNNNDLNQSMYEDIPNPFDLGGNGADCYGVKEANYLPPAAVITLQVIFYTMLAFILIYLVSHWIFHSWSFMNIFKISFNKRVQNDQVRLSLSDRIMPWITVLMFILYTAYMIGFVFVTLIMMQFNKYYKGFLTLTTKATRNQLNILLWLFFAMAMFPAFLHIVMTLIGVVRYFLFKSKTDATSKLKELTVELIDTYPDQVRFSAAPPPTSQKTVKSTDNSNPNNVIPHSSSCLPDMAAKGLPLVYIMIPVYNEPLPTLMGALNTVAALQYPRLRIYVGFDNYNIEQTFFTLCRLMSGVPLLKPVPKSLSSASFLSHRRASSYQFGSDSGSTIDLISIASHVTDPIKIGRKVHKYNGFDQIINDPNSGSRSPSLYSNSLPDIQSRANSFYGSPIRNTDISFFNNINETGSLVNSPRSKFCAPVTAVSDYLEVYDWDVDHCPDEHTLEYRGVRFTIHRFPHTGKLGTQRAMFERMQIELEKEDDAEEPLVLFMDSDTAIMPDCVSQLDAEYIESMIFRNSEAFLGAVTCLPGVMTMFKYSSLCSVANEYFYQPRVTDTFDYCRRYLGEDRFITHLLMQRHKRGSLGFNLNAICKTEAPSDFSNLLRQRRRWFLGSITNEIFMICTPEFWVKFPLLQLAKFFMVLKVGGAISYILLMELVFNIIFDTKSTSYGVFFWLMVIIIPNWIFVTTWAIKERRLKTVLVFPVYYWFNPFFTIALLIFSFLTARSNTWGGPRAAASTKDSNPGTKVSSSSSSSGSEDDAKG